MIQYIAQHLPGIQELMLIGYRNSYQTASAPYNAIAIGTGLSPSNSGFLIGFAPSPLISGSLGGGNRNFVLKNAQFGIHGIYDEQQQWDTGKWKRSVEQAGEEKYT